MDVVEQDGAEKIIEDNFEKFMDIVYPENAKEWISDVVPLGTPIPIELRKGELATPLCWYKVMVLGIGDDKGVPAQNISMSILAFFGPALEDYVALAALAIPTIQKLCSHLTVKEFHTNHWAQTHNPTR
uniref:Uncharacterized protein n=1 Tax=Moniliophthora roreri TaxID=221103 RepID=A0A0W0FKQ1_MONRR